MIDGIMSGKLLMNPITGMNRRGKTYAVGKLSVFAYSNSNIQPLPLQADLIAFDRVAAGRLLSCKAGDVISVAGVITPVIDKSIGLDEPIVLKTTVHHVLDGYVYEQAKGKGALFDLIRV